MLPHIDFPERLRTPLAITNVTVVPMDTERLLSRHTVIVEDGVIRAIGPTATLDLTGIDVIDGGGRYLLPGLADMHVHYSSPTDAVLFLALGVTTVRNMGGAPFHLALRRKVEQGELPGPRIVCASPILEGPGPDTHVVHRISDADEAPTLVRQFAQRGYQQLKVYNELNPDVFQALGRASEEHGLPVVGHCPNAMTFEEAMSAGMRCFEHLSGIWRGRLRGGIVQAVGVSNLNIDLMRATADCLDFDSVRRLAGRLAAGRVWNCPTLVAMQRMYEPQTIGIADPEVQPWLEYIPAMAIDFWAWLDTLQERAQGRAGPRDEWLSANRARVAAFLRVVSIMHAEGAPLLLGTDTAVRFVIPGLSIHQELANFVAAGLSPFQALRCGTAEAARFVGESDRWGTIGVGKRADLILVRSNPLEDVAALREPEAVFSNEYFLPRDTIDDLLAQAKHLAALRPPRSLPDIDLEPAAADEFVVSEGSLIERVDGRETGRVRYRHIRLPNGDHRIEERYAFDRTADIFTMAGGQRRSTRLVLSNDYRLHRAESVTESFAGSTECTIRWLDDRGYEVRVREIDGVETQSTVEGEALAPGDHLAMTVLPAWLTEQSEAVISAELLRLDVRPDTPAPSTTLATVNRAPQSESGVERLYHVSSDESNTTTQSILLSNSGQIVRITRGQTELAPPTEVGGELT